MSTIKLSKNILKKLYLNQRLSTWKIERLVGISRSVIYNRLKRFGIRPRSISDSHIQYPKRPFSGNQNDKAYLVGFSIGDLRVRKVGGLRSQTISIACASTKPAQIELIRKLFAPYGRVWLSHPNNRGVVFVEAFVDSSFSFLLRPEIARYNWVFYNKNLFLSFLAGFTDAEGSFFIQKRDNQAVISLGNYNFQIFKKIKKALNKLNVRTSSVFCDWLKDYQGKDGSKRKADYYHLSCAQKKSLLLLFSLLKLFIRHADKKKALGIGLENIEMRNKKFGFINM